MPSAVLNRPAEYRQISDFLASASIEPAALLVEGEAGIGKTTLWLAAVDQAGEDGLRVLSARAAAAESVLAYASLSDMLGGVDPAAWHSFPIRSGSRLTGCCCERRAMASQPINAQ